MASFTVPRARGLLLVISVVVIVLLILRAYMNVPFGGSSAFGGTTRSNEISMLTYNIWKFADQMRARMEVLGQVVEDLEPDLLVFQEVTLKNLAILQEQRWFSKYHLIPPDVVKQLKMGPPNFVVIILSAYPVEKWQVYPFKNNVEYKGSKYELRLVIAETKSSVSSENIRFVFAGTHLAWAGFRTRLREAQLKESFQIISGYDNVCVMGDMNIEDKADGDIVLPLPWIDAWLSIPGNTDSNGYTWDRSKTPFASVLRRTVNATSYQARLDRVLCKLSDFKVKDMRIVGNQLTKSGILPSDHFGLFTVLELAEKSELEDNKNKQPQSESEVYFNRPPGWEKVN
ncbi:hypothetical protein ACROYT_G010406 [Oculina patagonica]